MSESQVALGRALVRAKEKASRLSAQAEAAKRAANDVEDSFWEALDDAQTKTVTLDLGEGFGEVRFTRRETIYGRVIPGREAEAAAALAELGLDAEILDDRPTVRKRILNEYVADWVKQRKPLPPGIDFYSVRGVTVTRKRKKG